MIFQVFVAVALLGQVESTPYTREVRVQKGESELSGRSLRASIFEPVSPTTADFVFNLGMGDTPQTHAALFNEMNREGIRVIVPHYPSLNWTTMRNLAQDNADIEFMVREDRQRPLLTGGWSMGGLLAYRTLQEPNYGFWERPIAGTILHAPATHPRYFIGAYRSGVLTTSSITTNRSPPNNGKMGIPVPALQIPFFLSNLLYHSSKAQDVLEIAEGQSTGPLRTPMLVVVGAQSGPKRDRSVDSNAVYEHFSNINALRAFHSKIDAVPAVPLLQVQYNAPHALDWEPEPVGSEVRLLSREFARGVIDQHMTRGFCNNIAALLGAHALRSKY